MTRPLVVIALIFSSGIIASSVIDIPFLVIYFLSLALLAFSFLLFKKEAAFGTIYLPLIFCLGALFLKNSQILPRNHISKLIYYRAPHLYAVKGVIDSQPEVKNNRTVFILQAEELQANQYQYKCRGRVLVLVKGKDKFHYAEKLVLRGKLYPPSRKQQGWRNYLIRQGVYTIMQAKTVVRSGARSSRIIKRFAFWLKQKVQGIILQHLSGLSASIMDAMILGEKKGIPAPLYNSMVRSGTVHILVVSGFNVGIVAFIIVLVLRLVRIGPRARILISIPLLIVYCLLTGASNPVVRATVMAVIFLFARLVQREPDIYNSLASAALFILLANPRQLFDIGFQLSFVSVIAIIWLYPKLESWLHLETFSNRGFRFIIDGCLVSFSAWLGTAGFIAYYFKFFSPITVLANIIIVPLATFITLCGFSIVLTSPITPGLSRQFVPAAEIAVLLLVKINTFLVSLPGASLFWG